MNQYFILSVCPLRRNKSFVHLQYSYSSLISRLHLSFIIAIEKYIFVWIASYFFVAKGNKEFAPILIWSQLISHPPLAKYHIDMIDAGLPPVK